MVSKNFCNIKDLKIKDRCTLGRTLGILRSLSWGYHLSYSCRHFWLLLVLANLFPYFAFAQDSEPQELPAAVFLPIEEAFESQSPQAAMEENESHRKYPIDTERLIRILRGEEKLDPSEKSFTEKGVGLFTVHMVKFFMAVTVLEGANCFLKNDPMDCQAFWDSQKTAGPWVGYTFFSLSAMGTGKLMHTIGQTPLGLKAVQSTLWINRFFPLWAGHLANSIYSEISNSIEFQELLVSSKIPDFKERWLARVRAMNGLWRFSLGSGRWWFHQGPDIAGLAIATFLSTKITNSLQAGFKRLAEKTAKIPGLSYLSRGSQLGYEFLSGYKSYQLLKTRLSGFSIKLLAKGGVIGIRLYPKFWVALGTAETIQFLGIAHLVTEPLAHAFYVTEALFDLGDSETHLHKLLMKPISLEPYPEIPDLPPDDLVKLKDSISRLQQHWDQVRRVEILKSLQTLQKYLYAIHKLDFPSHQIRHYYHWLTHGAHKSSMYWLFNEGNWHLPDDPPGFVTSLFQPGFYSSTVEGEIIKMANAFFCGPPVDKAIIPAQDFHGMPGPRQINTTILPYRVAEDSTFLCDSKVIPKLTPHVDLRVSLNLSEYQRVSLLFNSLSLRDWKAPFQKAHENFEAILEPIREQWIKKYEEKTTLSIIRSLEGEFVEHSLHSFTPPITQMHDIAVPPRVSYGYIPLIQEEIIYWEGLIKKFPTLESYFSDAIARARRLRKQAEIILSFYKKPNPDLKARIHGFSKNTEPQTKSLEAGQPKNKMTKMETSNSRRVNPYENPEANVIEMLKNLILK